MVVRPGAGADFTPKLDLIGCDEISAMRGVMHSRLRDWPMQDTGNLYRAIAASAKEFQRFDADEWTDFVLDGCAAGGKPTFDFVKNLGRHGIRKDQARRFE